jgi:hypothetical protein
MFSVPRGTKPELLIFALKTGDDGIPGDVHAYISARYVFLELRWAVS